MKRTAKLIAMCASVLLAAAPGLAQDANIFMPISEVEARMRSDSSEIGWVMASVIARNVVTKQSTWEGWNASLRSQ